LEKIHGSSAHLSWDGTNLSFFSGGEKHEKFILLFNADAIKSKLLEAGIGAGRKATVYGEVYGGKCQGMSKTYGKEMKFVAFDVIIDNMWLDVPNAESFVKTLGLAFVHYVKVSTDLKTLDEQRDAPSVQAIRNGVSMIAPNGADIHYPAGMAVVPYGQFGDRLVNPQKREGVVLRPIIELTRNNGSRIVAKHKGDDFRETKTPRPVVDPTKMQVLEDAEKIAEEYVTATRLQHILDKLPGHNIERMRDIISAMIEDVNREGQNEFVPSEAVNKAIGKKTAMSYKTYLNFQIGSR
jgi:hypothetical protein